MWIILTKKYILFTRLTYCFHRGNLQTLSPVTEPAFFISSQTIWEDENTGVAPEPRENLAPAAIATLSNKRPLIFYLTVNNNKLTSEVADGDIQAGLQILRVRERVSERQAAFVVRVLDDNGLSFQGQDHIPWLYRRPTGHVLEQRYQPSFTKNILLLLFQDGFSNNIPGIS